MKFLTSDFGYSQVVSSFLARDGEFGVRPISRRKPDISLPPSISRLSASTRPAPDTPLCIIWYQSRRSIHPGFEIRQFIVAEPSPSPLGSIRSASADLAVHHLQEGIHLVSISFITLHSASSNTNCHANHQIFTIQKKKLIHRFIPITDPNLTNLNQHRSPPNTKSKSSPNLRNRTLILTSILNPIQTNT